MTVADATAEAAAVAEMTAVATVEDTAAAETTVDQEETTIAAREEMIIVAAATGTMTVDAATTALTMVAARKAAESIMVTAITAATKVLLTNNLKQNIMSYILAPSILSADFARLGEAVEMIDKSEAEWVHVDIMDGVFVPNITFGFPVMKAVRKYTKKPFDVHLMIVQPERYIKDFKQAGADVLTVQYEACTHLHRTIAAIKEEGMQAGVALNPHSPVSLLESIIMDLDLVLIMSVNPGFGGQKFIPNTFNKLRELQDMQARHNTHARVEIDGGVSLQNTAQLLEAGADTLVAGNAVFSTPDPLETIRQFKAIKAGVRTV